MTTKSQLAILLSKLKDFEEQDISLEQYSTPSEIAADILWNAYLQKDIKNKVVLDAACGPGFFGIGALILGAKNVIFLDISKKALELVKENIEKIEKEGPTGKYHFVNHDIKQFDQKVDVVLQNPPFGVKKAHADRGFLEKAFEVGEVVYSVHKIESKAFIEAFSEDNNFKITHLWPYDFGLKATQKYHRRRIYRFKVGCWRIERQCQE